VRGGNRVEFVDAVSLPSEDTTPPAIPALVPAQAGEASDQHPGA